MGELYTRFDSVFFEKTRLSLMTILFKKEMSSFNALKEKMQLSDGALYTHLEKLIGAGYAEKRKELAGMSVNTVYLLTGEGKDAFLTYIDFLKTMIGSMEIEEDRNEE
jgi:DNA-binding MarR family transcriptional regulator